MNFFNYVSEKKIVFLIISLLINFLLLSLCCYFIWNLYTYECDCSNDLDVSNPIVEETTITKKYYVDIKGAVKKPGVYEVNSENIINDVIKLAGGFTKTAYTKNINLSKRVSDELVIYVYSENEYKKLAEEKKENDSIVEEIITTECVCPEYEISDCINSGSSEIVADNSNNLETNNDNNIKENVKNEQEDIKNEIKLININTASVEELMSLSGIGESKAKAIIEYRNKTKFNTIEEIKNVSGIGDSAFEKIKNSITVK